MPDYLRVCPDCGDEKIYHNRRPCRRPPEGTKCKTCSAKTARSLNPNTFGAPPPPPPPPEEDVDWVVVERLTHGIPVVSNLAERIEAVKYLDSRYRPYTDYEIGNLMFVQGKTVRSLRARAAKQEPKAA